MQGDAPTDFKLRLRDAGRDDLVRLVQRHLDEIDPAAARQLLRNPHLTKQIIDLLISQRQLLAYQEVRRELAGHPKTPEVQALRFVAGLFWRDLLEISSDVRVRPRVRRAAERHLASRMPSLAVGERIAIARQASPMLIAQLRSDGEPQVIEALLDNPRLTEGALMPLVSSDLAKPEILAQVARHRQWGTRYPIRQSLCRNRRTPVEMTLSLMPHLKKRDLSAIEQERRLPAVVRRRAAVLLGHTPP